jgi:hypothetical protein
MNVTSSPLEMLSFYVFFEQWLGTRNAVKARHKTNCGHTEMYSILTMRWTIGRFFGDRSNGAKISSESPLKRYTLTTESTNMYMKLINDLHRAD